MKKHNFGAGPCVLPQQVIDNTAKAVLNFNDSGLSVMEISHRSPEWEHIMHECHKLWVELLNIPDNYSIALQGAGATLQFVQVAYNLLNKKAAYLDTGVWASKAIQEAEAFGEVKVVASGKENGYTKIPRNYVVPADADYFHITTNNTVYGTQFHEDIDCNIPLVADMSSDILSRRIDIHKYGLIYGGAQKNAGTAGVSFIIVRNDILGKVERKIPGMLDYRSLIKNESMYNTPPVLPIYVMYEMLLWIKSVGGVDEMRKRSIVRSDMLYAELDRNKLFVAPAAKEDRSIMNARFVMAPGFEDKMDDFLNFADTYGIVGIKGHRVAGGFRASIYNGLPTDSVQVLIDCMRAYEANI